jgi:hypothetical protein
MVTIILVIRQTYNKMLYVRFEEEIECIFLPKSRSGDNDFHIV